MEQQNSCADCLNLGRAVYCMQCVRLNKGHKDMFRSNAPVTLHCKPKNTKIVVSQPEKR